MPSLSTPVEGHPTALEGQGAREGISRASAAGLGGEAAPGKRQEQTQSRNECEKSRLCSGWGITEGLKV